MHTVVVVMAVMRMGGGGDNLTHNDDYFMKIQEVLFTMHGLRLLSNKNKNSYGNSGGTSASTPISAPKVIWEHGLLKTYDHTLKTAHNTIVRSKPKSITKPNTNANAHLEYLDDNSVGLLPLKAFLYVSNDMLYMEVLMNWTSSIVYPYTHTYSRDDTGTGDSNTGDSNTETGFGSGSVLGYMQVYSGNMWILRVSNVNRTVLPQYGIVTLGSVYNPIPLTSNAHYDSVTRYNILDMFTNKVNMHGSGTESGVGSGSGTEDCNNTTIR